MRISDWSSDVCSSDLLLSRIPNPSSRITAFSTTAKGRGLSPPASAGRPYRWRRKDRLLHFDRGTGRFQVLLELGSFFLRNAFLDRATGFGQVLGFLQAQAGDRADHLDDLDLLLAGGLQVDRELGLLFGSGGTGGCRTGGNGPRGGGGQAALLFHRLDQLRHLDEGLAAADRKSTRLHSSHQYASRMPYSARNKKSFLY